MTSAAASSLKSLETPRGRAVGVRGGAGRDRRAAAGPGPAADAAGDHRRVAAARRPRERRAGGLGLIAGRGTRAAPATRSRRTRSGSRPSCCRGGRPCPGRRCRCWPGCTRWPRPAPCPTSGSAGRATRRPPPGCAGSPTCSRRVPTSRPCWSPRWRTPELVAAAPFGSHNGVLARAVERLVLVSRGVDEKSLVVPELGHLANRAAYESNLGAYRDGGSGGGPRVAAVRRGGVRRGRRGEPAQRRAETSRDSRVLRPPRGRTHCSRSSHRRPITRPCLPARMGVDMRHTTSRATRESGTHAAIYPLEEGACHTGTRPGQQLDVARLVAHDSACQRWHSRSWRTRVPPASVGSLARDFRPPAAASGRWPTARHPPPGRHPPRAPRWSAWRAGAAPGCAARPAW